jgi:hypothetical protein
MEKPAADESKPVAEENTEAPSLTLYVCFAQILPFFPKVILCHFISNFVLSAFFEFHHLLKGLFFLTLHFAYQ